MRNTLPAYHALYLSYSVGLKNNREKLCGTKEVEMKANSRQRVVSFVNGGESCMYIMSLGSEMKKEFSHI